MARAIIRVLGPLLALSLAACGSSSQSETVELSPSSVPAAAPAASDTVAAVSSAGTSELTPTIAVLPEQAQETAAAAISDDDFVDAVAQTLPLATLVVSGRATNYRLVDQPAPLDTKNCGYAEVVANVTVDKIYQGPADIPSAIEVSWFLECPIDLAQLPTRALFFLGPIDDTPTDPSAPPTSPSVTLPTSKRVRWNALENSTFPITDKDLPLIEKARSRPPVT
jgi:hypothetical protein